MNTEHIMFNDEVAESFVTGCRLLTELVRDSLVAGEMPPKPVFDWYVGYVLYHFTQAEVAHARAPNDEQKKLHYAELAEEMHLLRQIAGGADMFTLTHKISEVLRARTMQLPPEFKPALQP